ncbi:peptidase family M41 domain protein, partial [Bordetella bronchiseptica E010]
MGGELETPGPGQGWTSLKECLSAVQRAVAARVGGQHSAPDLVQEAYARMLDRPAAASLVNLPGYLYRAALNIAYNGSARNSVENRVHGQLALSGDEASAALDPARICADRQALGRVMAAIDALPPRCREVFVLYRFEGLAQAESPDIRGREQILKVHMRKVPLSPNVDATILARGTPGFSGADLANLVNEAALFAARRNGRTVDMSDFEKAKDKIIMGAERRSIVMPEEERKNTAYH